MNDSGWRLSVKCHAGLTYYGLGTEHWRQAWRNLPCHIKHLSDIGLQPTFWPRYQSEHFGSGPTIASLMIFVDSLPVVSWSKIVSLGSVNAGRTIWVALEVSSEFIHPRNSMQGPVLSVESNSMAQ